MYIYMCVCVRVCVCVCIQMNCSRSILLLPCILKCILLRSSRGTVRDGGAFVHSAFR